MHYFLPVGTQLSWTPSLWQIFYQYPVTWLESNTSHSPVVLFITFSWGLLAIFSNLVSCSHLLTTVQRCDSCMFQPLSCNQRAGQPITGEPYHTRGRTVNILLLHPSCSWKHVQFEADVLSTHFFPLFIEYTAFEEMSNLISPLGCTVDGNCSIIQFENERFPPIVIIFEKDHSRPWLWWSFSGYPKYGIKSWNIFSAVVFPDLFFCWIGLHELRELIDEDQDIVISFLTWLQM